MALTQVKLPSLLPSQYNKVVTLEELQYSLESIVVEFSETEDLVEVVPQVRADLPFTLTRKAAIWVESEQLEASAYHLHHLYSITIKAFWQSNISTISGIIWIGTAEDIIQGLYPTL